MSFALRVYRRLADAFPHEFKLVYGAEVIQSGEDVVAEIAKERGFAGLIRLILDIAIRVPIEYLNEMRRDLRYALRALIKSPGFALVAIVSAGIGIGLTTTVYSTELADVFRKLPAAANVDRLVMPEKPVSYYDVEQYRHEKSLFQGVAAFENGVPFNVVFAQNSKPQRVMGQLVSPDYFSVLGVQAERGRMLSADLDQRGTAPAVVISDQFWRSRLNSSAEAVGETVRLNGQLATIVGIAPKNFGGADTDTPFELFVPTTAPAALAPELANDVLNQRSAKIFQAMLCLAPGVTIDRAEAALDTIARRLERQELSSSSSSAEDKSRRVSLMPAGTTQPIPRAFRRAAIGFFVALMALIMTIVCMNLANMLLARGAARRKELAIRLSVGASRFRLIRQMVTEGILLSLLGGAAGFVLAQVLSILSMRANQAAPVDYKLDWSGAGIAFALAIVCGIGFSLVPALRATKCDVTPALKQGSMLAVPGHRRFGLRNFLMVGQLAGSLMLLMMTGFLALGARQAANIQTKFDPDSMYLVSIDPVRDGYSAEKAQALFEKLPRQLANNGSLRGMALAVQPPFSIEDLTAQFAARDSKGTRVEAPANREVVGAGYFATLDESMLAGREFGERDIPKSAQFSKTQALPAVLNESAARRLFGNRNAIGEQIEDDHRSYQVIGVVHDLKNGIGLRKAVVYLPLTPEDFARPPARGVIVLVRSGAGADALGAVRNTIASMDPNLTVFNTQTLTAWLEVSRSDLRTAVRIYGGIGIFGVLLAAIGLAGVTAYVVTQRRKEIGIRVALGARKGQVLALVLRDGLALVCVGTILGFAGAVAIAKLLSALTSVIADALQVGTNDVRLLAGAPLLLAFITMIACYVPARKAIRIDPLKMLREE